MYERNAFVTLTYDDDHLPDRGCLVYADFQKFMKRLRKAVQVPVRFYMCGEYGSENGRPHFHSCLFGWDADDKTYWRKSEAGAKCYRSALLEQLWPFGHAELGAITFESAAYAARYCVQKVTGDAAQAHYSRTDSRGSYQLPPEFNRMSLKPGIGARWLQKWQGDVYPHDYVVINAKEVKPPKFYDRRYARSDPEAWEQIQFQRELDARSRADDNTPARLVAKEIVATARASLYSRSL